nr:MAG TPA: hypothetical protein [Caudoviricetes sp.]
MIKSPYVFIPSDGELNNGNVHLIPSNKYCGRNKT